MKDEDFIVRALFSTPSGKLPIRDYLSERAFSIAAIKSLLSGVTFGSKRAMTSPLRSMTNFSKFQRTLPAPLG